MPVNNRTKAVDMLQHESTSTTNRRKKPEIIGLNQRTNYRSIVRQEYVDDDDFQKLTIDIPKAEGPGGKHMGSVQWTINGKIIITSEAYDKNNQVKK